MRFQRRSLIDRSFHLVVSPHRSAIKPSSQTRVSIGSPQWRTSLDERPYSSLDSRTRASISNPQRSSDEMRQLIMQTIRNSVHANGTKTEENFTSFNNLFFRRRPGNSMLDLNQENNLNRVSLRSISYGFGLGTKTWSNALDPPVPSSSTPMEPTVISPNYRLPSNKIDLDVNQESFIRLPGSLKRKSDH